MSTEARAIKNNQWSGFLLRSFEVVVVEKYSNMQYFTFKGEVFFVPEYFNWLAVDGNGDIVVFKSKPSISSWAGRGLVGQKWASLDDYLIVGKASLDDPFEWEKSLVSVGSLKSVD